MPGAENYCPLGKARVYSRVGLVDDCAPPSSVMRSAELRCARHNSPLTGTVKMLPVVSGSTVGAVTKRDFTARRTLVVVLIRLGLSRLVSLGRSQTQTKEFEDHVHKHED
jgi:hypothetical protein